MRSLHLSGYVSFAIASMLFGVAGAFAKVLFHQEIQPLDLTILRAILASLVIGLIALLRQVSLAINLKDARFLLIQGLLLSAVNYTFYLAISATGVAVAIMLEYTAPIFVVLINLLLGKARFDHTTATVLPLGTCGCFLLVGAYSASSSSSPPSSTSAPESAGLICLNLCGRPVRSIPPLLSLPRRKT